MSDGDLRSRIDQLNPEAAVAAFAAVGKSWAQHRGLDVFAIYQETCNLVDRETFQNMPEWIRGQPEVNDHSVALAKDMLVILSGADLQDDEEHADPEVQKWAIDAIDEALQTSAQVAISTLIISGTFLIGAILASRVKKIEWGKFKVSFGKEWNGEDVAKAVKAGASVVVPKP